MTRLILPSRFSRQPQQAAPIDWSNPLTNGLVFAWVASNPLLDVVSGKLGAYSGSIPTQQPLYDRISTAGNATSYLTWGVRPDLNFFGLSNQTLFAEVIITSPSTVTGNVLGEVVGAHNFRLGIESGSQSFEFGTGGSPLAASAISGFQALIPYSNRPVPFAGTYDKINAKIYLDGSLKNTTAQTGSFPNNSDPFSILSRGTIGQLDGANVTIALVFKRTLTDSEIASLSANPWQIFKAPSRKIYVSAAGGGSDVTVAITGVSATGSVGSVTPSASVAITGNAGTGAAGTVSPNTSLSATGNAATGSAGSVTPSTSVALLGNAATGAAGTVSLGSDVTVAISGVAGTGSVGTVSPGNSVAVTGNVGAGSVGTVSPTASLTITGNAGTGSVGSVATSRSVALSGNVGTGSVGNVGVVGDVTVSITGVSATGSVGSVTTDSGVFGRAGAGGDDAPRLEIYEKRKVKRTAQDEEEERKEILRATLNKMRGIEPEAQEVEIVVQPAKPIAAKGKTVIATPEIVNAILGRRKTSIVKAVLIDESEEDDEETLLMLL